jgi:hypothetical protein
MTNRSSTAPRCTDCGDPAYIRYTNWKNDAGEQVVKRSEKICSACAESRGLSVPYDSKKLGIQEDTPIRV